MHTECVKPGAGADPEQVMALSTCLASMVMYWFLMLHAWFTFDKWQDVESEESMSIVSESEEEEEAVDDVRSLALLSGLHDELLEAFPYSRAINIGMDETYDLGDCVSRNEVQRSAEEEQETEGAAGMWAEAVGRVRAQHADGRSRRAIAHACMAHTESLDRGTHEPCPRGIQSFDEQHLCSPVKLRVTQVQDSKLPDLDEWMQELKRITRQRKHSPHTSWHHCPSNHTGCEHEDACPDVASMAKKGYPAGPSPADPLSLSSSSFPLDKAICMHQVTVQVIGSAPSATCRRTARIGSNQAPGYGGRRQETPSPDEVQESTARCMSS